MGGQEINFWADLLNALNPNQIYDYGWYFAGIVSVFAGAGFTFSIGSRAISDKIAASKGQAGSPQAAYMDILMACLGYTVYMLVTGLAVYLIREAHEALNAFNHKGIVGEAFAEVRATLAGDDVGFKLSDVWNSILAMICFVAFIVTHFIQIGVALFLHFAHAFCFALLIAVGPLFISLAPWSGTNYIKGWARFGAVLIFWPLVEFVVVGLTAQVFNGASEVIGDPKYQELGVFGLRVMMWGGMTLMNLIMIAINLSVALITFALISNSGNPASAVLPFAGAGAAAGGIAGKSVVDQAKQTGNNLGGQLSGAMSKAGQSLVQNETIRSMFPGVAQAFPGNKPGSGIGGGFSAPGQSGARSSSPSGDVRPGSVSAQMSSLENTPVERDGNSIRNTSIAGHGRGQGAESPIRSMNSPSAGEGLSLEPIPNEDKAGTGSPSVSDNQTSNKPQKSGGAKDLYAQASGTNMKSQLVSTLSGEDDPGQRPNTDNGGADGNEGQTKRKGQRTEKARKQRKGVFAHQSMVNNGTRKPKK